VGKNVGKWAKTWAKLSFVLGPLSFKSVMSSELLRDKVKIDVLTTLVGELLHGRINSQ
jgi:hypothetical protein